MLFVVGEGITTVNLGIFDDVGNSRAIFLGQVLNVVLTFLFVGTFEMGISSAGLALIVSTLTNSAYMIFNYLRLPERSLKFVNVFKSGAKKFFSQSVEVIKSGIPAACSVSLNFDKGFCDISVTRRHRRRRVNDAVRKFAWRVFPSCQCALPVATAQ